MARVTELCVLWSAYVLLGLNLPVIVFCTRTDEGSGLLVFAFKGTDRDQDDSLSIGDVSDLKV